MFKCLKTTTLNKYLNKFNGNILPKYVKEKVNCELQYRFLKNVVKNPKKIIIWLKLFRLHTVKKALYHSKISFCITAQTFLI